MGVLQDAGGRLANSDVGQTVKHWGESVSGVFGPPAKVKGPDYSGAKPIDTTELEKNKAAAQMPQMTVPTQGYAAGTAQAATVAGMPGHPTAATVQLPGQGPNVSTIAATPAMQAAALQMGPQGQQSQAAQMALIQQLQQQAAGQGPSVAEMQLKQGQEANLAAIMAQMNSSRGAANPLLQRNAMNVSADIQAQTNRDMAMARLQEQLAAQGLLGQTAGTVSQQALQAAQANATFQQAANQQNYQGQLQTNLTQAGFQQDANMAQYGAGVQAALANAGYQQQAGLAGYQGDMQAALANAGYQQQANMAQFGADNSANAALFNAQQNAGQVNAQLQQNYNGLIAQYTQMGLGAQEAQQMAAIQMANGQYQANAVNTAARNGFNQQIMGAVLGTAGQIAGGYAMSGLTGGGAAAGAAGAASPYNSQTGDFQPAGSNPYSDEALKTDIKPADKKLESFLEALSSSEYRYKNPKHGEGKFVSPMAQEFLKSEIGRSMVEQGEDGLRVNYGRAAGTILSAQSLIMKRLKELESARGENKKGKK